MPRRFAIGLILTTFALMAVFFGLQRTGLLGQYVNNYTTVTRGFCCSTHPYNFCGEMSIADARKCNKGETLKMNGKNDCIQSCDLVMPGACCETHGQLQTAR